MYEPAEIYAGDSLEWRESLSDYPASAGWQLRYRLVGSAGSYQVSSVAAGDEHLVQVAAATTAAWAPGGYALVRYVVRGSERVTLGSSRLVVRPDLAGAATAVDTRSHARRTLDAIEAVIEGRATHDQLETTIAGTTLRRMPVGDLLRLRSVYLEECRREEAAERLALGLEAGGVIRVRL